MATGQVASVYGMGTGRRIRTPYAEQIQSAYGQATADVIARKKKEQEEQQRQFDNKIATDQFNLDKMNFALGVQRDKAAADAQQRSMGLNIGTLGMNLANQAQASGNNSGLSKLMNKGFGSLGINTGGINLGSALGSGLAGYGAYQAMGGGAKGLAAGLGMGIATDALTKGGLTSSALGLLGKGASKIGMDSLGSGLGFLSGLF